MMREKLMTIVKRFCRARMIRNRSAGCEGGTHAVGLGEARLLAPGCTSGSSQSVELESGDSVESLRSDLVLASLGGRKREVRTMRRSMFHAAKFHMTMDQTFL